MNIKIDNLEGITTPKSFRPDLYDGKYIILSNEATLYKTSEEAMTRIKELANANNGNIRGLFKLTSITVLETESVIKMVNPTIEEKEVNQKTRKINVGN